MIRKKVHQSYPPPPPKKSISLPSPSTFVQFYTKTCFPNLSGEKVWGFGIAIILRCLSTFYIDLAIDFSAQLLDFEMGSASNAGLSPCMGLGKGDNGCLTTRVLDNKLVHNCSFEHQS